MSLGGGVAFGVLEGFRGRKLDDIEGRGVIGHIPTMAERCAGRIEELLGVFEELQRLAVGFRLGLIVGGESVDLLYVENRISLHEGDFALDGVAVVGGLFLGEAVGIDYEGTMLAFAHLGADGFGLLVCHPYIGGVTLGHGFAPEKKDIDSLIGRAVMAKRASNAAFRVAGVPWFQPRADSLLKVGDDALG